jgi:hypothetical protein
MNPTTTELNAGRCQMCDDPGERCSGCGAVLCPSCLAWIEGCCEARRGRCEVCGGLTPGPGVPYCSTACVEADGT